MARRPSLALLIIVAGAFFLIGLYTAFLQGTPTESGVPTRAPTTPDPTSPPARAEETILFLGVDELQTSEPTLVAIWFLSFRPPAKDLFLLGIPADLVASGDPPEALHDSFAFDPQAGPAAGFLDALYRTVPLDVTAIVVLDEVAFATAVDYVGGVTINEATFTGQEVLGILSLSSDSPAGTLTLQKRILGSLAAQAPALGTSPEITELVDLTPEHMYTSKSLNELVGLIAPLLPIQPATTHIELY